MVANVNNEISLKPSETDKSKQKRVLVKMWLEKLSSSHQAQLINLKELIIMWLLSTKVLQIRKLMSFLRWSRALSRHR